MIKSDLTKQFATRLRKAMIEAGYNSTRSSSGVDIPMLAEITGYSVQICRKYLRGEAIPEPVKLVELSAKLKVSPGWLLFGEMSEPSQQDRHKILISKNLLHYLFNKAAYLYSSQQRGHEISDFLMDLINDVSLINANEEQSKKIIDLAISSIKHFQQ